MGSIGVQLDQRTLDRLDALSLILREVDPSCRCDRNEALRLSVEVGIKVLLGELLSRHRKGEKNRTWAAQSAGN